MDVAIARPAVRRKAPHPGATFHRRPPPRWVQWLLPSSVILLVVGVAFASPGENPGAGRDLVDPETGEHVFEHTWSPLAVSAIAIGIAGAYLLLAYRWPLGFLLGRRRHRIHS